jgi:hypothetical protein
MASARSHRLGNSALPVAHLVARPNIRPIAIMDPAGGNNIQHSKLRKATVLSFFSSGKMS